MYNKLTAAADSQMTHQGGYRDYGCRSFPGPCSSLERRSQERFCLYIRVHKIRTHDLRNMAECMPVR